MQVTPRSCEVVELLRQPVEVADAVVVAVEERLDVHLVDDGVLVPERIVVVGRRCRRVSSSIAGVVDGQAVALRAGSRPSRMCAGATAGIEPHVVARPRARCSARRRAGRAPCSASPRRARRADSTRPCCMWCGSRLTTTSSRSEPSGAALAVADAARGCRSRGSAASRRAAAPGASRRIGLTRAISSLRLPGRSPVPVAGSGTSRSRDTPRCRA